jgi:Asp-tRNA(Asn)/Glu-tRNA(Gln) amidotransferase A subunit family amidase
MTEIHHLSATKLSNKISEGELSSLAVVNALLDRIEERNERSNAFITVSDSHARERAREMDRAFENGELFGPLHGVPVAIKDLNNAKDIRTTFGSKLFADHVAETDDPFVSRLKQAGAIVIGKTNTPEFGLGCTTDNRVIGPTGTPFAPERIAGGSSGGAGAALADHLVPLAQGTDTGGSIRTPASCCGVYGFKPSFGRVPRTQRPDAFGDHTPFSHTGPLTRTVEDAALMLDIMAGPHPRDPFSLPHDNTDYLSATDRSISGMTVGYTPDLGTYPVEPEVREVTSEAVDGLRDAGAIVEHADPDLGYDQETILDAFYTFAKVRWEALFDNLEKVHDLDPRGADRDQLRPITIETILESDEVSTREYKQADTVRTAVYDGIVELFETYDIIVTPTLGVAPFEHGAFPTEIDGVEVEPLRGWLLTQPFNFSGHPTASIPAGFTSDGLPIGMQIVGQRHGDDEVLAVSAAYERQRPWHDSYPI